MGFTCFGEREIAINVLNAIVAHDGIQSAFDVSDLF